MTFTAMESRFPNKCQHNVAVTRKIWGRSKRRYLDLVKEDVQEIGAREDEVFNQNVWRCDSFCNGESHYDQPGHTKTGML